MSCSPPAITAPTTSSRETTPISPRADGPAQLQQVKDTNENDTAEATTPLSPRAGALAQLQKNKETDENNTAGACSPVAPACSQKRARDEATTDDGAGAPKRRLKLTLGSRPDDSQTAKAAPRRKLVLTVGPRPANAQTPEAEYYGSSCGDHSEQATEFKALKSHPFVVRQREKQPTVPGLNQTSVIVMGTVLGDVEVHVLDVLEVEGNARGSHGVRIWYAIVVGIKSATYRVAANDVVFRVVWLGNRQWFLGQSFHKSVDKTGIKLFRAWLRLQPEDALWVCNMMTEFNGRKISGLVETQIPNATLCNRILICAKPASTGLINWIAQNAKSCKGVEPQEDKM